MKGGKVEPKSKNLKWYESPISVGPFAAGDCDPFAVLNRKRAREIAPPTSPRRGSRVEAVVVDDEAITMARAAIRNALSTSVGFDRSIIGGQSEYEQWRQSQLEAR
jgi:hypothetical protein